MTNDQLLEMVKQSDSAGQYYAENTWLIAFARCIAAATREEDARLVETLPAITGGYKGVAAAIRKRGE